MYDGSIYFADLLPEFEGRGVERIVQEVATEQLADQAGYLVENMPGLLSMIYNGEPIGIQLPQVVDMPIVECNPAVKGNSATGRTKPATLSTGLVVQVPEYLAPGELIRIDTSTGEFVCRAEPTKAF